MKQHHISVILPTYNESGSIVHLISSLISVLKNQAWPFEIVVCDDGSPDGTADMVAENFPPSSSVQVVRRVGERGLAFSVRDGLEKATGDTFVVMDADFNHDPQVVPYLVKYLDDFDLVSGSRFAPGGGMYSRPRHIGSFAINLFLRVVLHTQIQDNLSGFFAVRREQFEKLPKEAIFWGYGDYYFRLLFYAQRLGARILEIPVVYLSRKTGDSKTPLLRTALLYAWETLRLRWMYAPPLGPTISRLMRWGN